MVIKKPAKAGFYFPETLLRNSALGRKDATRRADITAGTPVFGLRPIRADLDNILNVPKPVILTSSPLTKDCSISSKIISIIL